MFDWEDLRYFCLFAQAGSLSAAAKVLRVDHATVARRIAALEAALGLKLVDRRQRAYVLTEEGKRVTTFGEQMNLASFALERFAGGEQDQVQGEVVVSSPPALAGTLLAPHLGTLMQRHPLLKVRLVGTKSRASLTRREADITVSLARPSEPTLVARRLGHLEFRLYASPDYLARTTDYSFIGYDESMEGSVQQDWLLQQAAGRPLALTSNDLRIQAIAAAGGAGVVSLPAFMAAQHPLQLLDPAGPCLVRQVWLAVHEDVRNAAPIRTVMDFIADCVTSA
ncbi:LysR family transcriptional regulator [Pseudomonas eucalypticola]|uniref:LysR family transcriptional regulator n=1 Tax=Pseudomonas eucalypticola TaxID=2599595 RepID=A0A7D5H0B8_9PSED|nr:LysR family transcriptional regulator [Pseudomonas eucalypticola]QKZ04567.1 LysR family transcriptional regulator [Pseudomonas eucalypticola]